MSLSTALKLGVDIRGIAPECVLGILITAQVYEARGVPLVLTSVKDSKHSEKSLHYVGRAFDCRLPSRYTHSEETDVHVYAELREALGMQFDVVLEPDHIHVEWDPKVIA